MSEERLKAFEQKADDQVARLVVLEQSPVSLLKQIFLTVDHLTGDGKKREAGDLCSRLSYLPSLLDKHLSVSSQTIDPAQYLIDFNELLQYLHFCELMPQVHKGYFDVDSHNSDEFHLFHKNSVLATYEIQDILLAELARPFCRENEGRLIQPLLEIMSKEPKTFCFPDHLMKDLISFYEDNLYDPVELPDAVFMEVTKCTAQEFVSLRNYLFAFSEFQLNMIACARILAKSFSNNYSDDAKEHLALCFMPGQNLVDEARKYTRIGKNKTLNILRPFMLDFSSTTSHKTSRNKHSDDGYFPPIIKLDDGYCLPPVAIKSFMSNRNLLFSFQRQNPFKFHSVVSKFFEPSLISLVNQELLAFSDIEVRLNHKWSTSTLESDIDILIYSPTLKKVLVIQVKAVIPPQGARMVRNIQSRILEGIEQIVRFRELPASEKERIVSESLGFQVSDLDFDDVVLSSSCLGSAAAWSELERLNICGTNYLLFQLLVHEAAYAKDSNLLFGISSWTQNKIEELMRESNISWEEKEFQIFGTSIRFPSWSIDEKPLNKIRNRILEARAA